MLKIAMKFKNYYPRYDKETPPFYKLLIDRFALSIKSPFETYNAEKNVLERELTNIKEQVLVISEEDLRDPHIKFFVEQNPGWKKASHGTATYSLTVSVCITGTPAGVCWPDCLDRCLSLDQTSLQQNVQTP